MAESPRALQIDAGQLAARLTEELEKLKEGEGKSGSGGGGERSGW